MQLQTLSFEKGRWSAEFPPLDSPQTLVLAFGAPGFAQDPAPLHALAQAFPTSHLMGCSTSGEIHGTRLVDDSIAIAVMRLEHGHLRRADAEVVAPEQSHAAGAAIARVLAAPDLRAVFVLSDGLIVNGSELVRGLNSLLPASVVVTGGLAGDGSRFQRTWTLTPAGPRTELISAVGIYGDRVALGHGSRGGWDIFGPERRITRSVGNVLYELDGRPALALYKDYLGERSAGLPATALLFPLAVRATVDDRTVVRTILSVDEATQSMTFAGDMPLHSLAQLMRANFDRIIQGAGDAGGIAAGAGLADDHPRLAIAISCVGRRLVLGERTEEEIEAVREALPAGTSQIGFYSYGEIAPQGLGSCELHNQTMTLTTIGER